MRMIWKQSALQSLIRLDVWREEHGWPAIAEHLVEIIESYFEQQDFSVFLPGRGVSIQGMPVNMRMTLIRPGKSDPYKVFYRYNQDAIEIFLIRHPYQKSLL
ncbi:type II toxin-antitoxin system RelE/ParE family toxin [Cohnella fermenti]|uniref:Type II toxin-antitoxin system RelE/ParE family toxin n=1 Tax=Cohnella fermenti TaxID=2565925 RepID=A0A4S4BM96_9BACL|nr:type II toxin-antitoxin system RelE/ParE family toxin [Cohnella fermenti]THF75367.1 type II toxin-antitoxin system RelE/ParE family toxin [Cohnella fermenti]